MKDGSHKIRPGKVIDISCGSIVKEVYTWYKDIRYGCGLIPSLPVPVLVNISEEQDRLCQLTGFFICVSGKSYNNQFCKILCPRARLTVNTFTIPTKSSAARDDASVY